jgi:hypothetical protein
MISGRLRLPGVALGALLAGGCAAYISPLQPPPYRDQIAAPYDVTWGALIRALAFDNVPLRAVAKDSGVIASDDIVSPIGVYADCGSMGDKPLEGETSSPSPSSCGRTAVTTDLQINSKMRTFRLEAGQAAVDPNYNACRPTAGSRISRMRRRIVKEWGCRPAPELVKARRPRPSATGFVQELAREWTKALRGQGFSARDLDELWAGLTEETVRRLLQTEARVAGGDAIRHEAREIIARVRARVESELAAGG